MADRVLRIGMNGRDVLQVQALLDAFIPDIPLLKMDAIFGLKTRARVVTFQKQHRLVPEGVVGPNTRAELLNGLAAINANLLNFNSWQDVIARH